MTGSAIASENEVAAVAFPDKYMVRLGTYIVESSDTQFSVTSDIGGIGTVIDFQRDLGGERLEKREVDGVLLECQAPAIDVDDANDAATSPHRGAHYLAQPQRDHAALLAQVILLGNVTHRGRLAAGSDAANDGAGSPEEE